MSRHRREVYQGVGLADPPPLPSVESDTELLNEPEPPEDFTPDTWLLMDNVPRDGSLIQIKMDPDADDAQAMLAVWRSTTMFDKQERRWRRIGYWADPITKRQLDGEPIVWRPASAAPILGLIT